MDDLTNNELRMIMAAMSQINSAPAGDLWLKAYKEMLYRDGVDKDLIADGRPPRYGVESGLPQRRLA